MDISVVNLVLATIIFVVGVLAHLKKRSVAALAIGIGFALFAATHLLSLLGMAAGLSSVVIALRIAGYLCALYGVFRIWSHN